MKMIEMKCRCGAEMRIEGGDENIWQDVDMIKLWMEDHKDCKPKESVTIATPFFLAGG